MLIDVELCQGADVNFKFAVCRKGVGKPVVQAMDSLYDQYVSLPQLKEIPLILPDPLFKVIVGKLHPLSLQKAGHIPVKQLHIQTFQNLIVVIAVFIPGAVHTVHKIIVHRNGMGL